MLTKLEVRTSQGSLLSLPLGETSEGITVAQIDGLDPVKAVLVSSSFARMDGQQYQTSHRETRNIKLKLGLDPDYTYTTVAELRKRVYSYLMPKSAISMRFYDDSGLIVDIDGRIETCESVLFSKDPMMDVSIICFDPDFHDWTPIVINDETTETINEVVIPYDGSVDSGLVFTLHVNRDLSEFTFYHRAPDNTFSSMDFAGDLHNGDTLTISTVPGDKYVKLTRGGTVSSLLYAISPESNWIQLNPGGNFVRVYAEGARVPYSIEYSTKYGGL